MNKPPSERSAKGSRPKRRGLDEFALPGGGSAADPPTGARALVPIQPTEAGGRDEKSDKASAKIRRVKIAPLLLNGDHPAAAGELRHAAEVHASTLPRSEIAATEATDVGAATGQSATQELRLDAPLPNIKGNVFTAAAAIAEYNERTHKLIIDTAITTFELARSLMNAKGPIEVANLSTSHLRILSELMIRHTVGLGSIARRLGTKPDA